MLLRILLHPLHDPVTVLLRVRISTLLRLHAFPQLELIRDIHPSLHRIAVLNSLEPLLELLERIRVDARPSGPVDPGKARDVCYAVLSTDDPEALASGLLFLEAVVEDLVQTLCLGLVAVYGILDFLWSITVEMVGLPLPARVRYQQ